MKNIVLALDFDGTLYPIDTYDSEQLLVLLSIKEGKMREEDIKAFIDHDKRGRLLPEEFNSLYESYLKGLDIHLVEETVDKILSSFDLKKLDSLKRILELPFIKPAILSCGSDVLIKEFLKKAGLKFDFHILSKEFKTEDNKFSHIIYHVTHIDDKKTELLKLKEKYDALTVAIGDGPTDISMLRAADYPFIISWGEDVKVKEFPVISGFDEVEKLIKELERV